MDSIVDRNILKDLLQKLSEDDRMLFKRTYSDMPTYSAELMHINDIVDALPDDNIHHVINQVEKMISKNQSK